MRLWDVVAGPTNTTYNKLESGAREDAFEEKGNAVVGHKPERVVEAAVLGDIKGECEERKQTEVVGTSPGCPEERDQHCRQPLSKLIEKVAMSGAG